MIGLLMAGWTVATWMPTSTEPFYMAMRIFGPEARAMNDEWEPPPVNKVL
jgi:hypothetical protein